MITHYPADDLSYRNLSENYKKVYPPVNIQKAIENGP